MYPDTFQRLWNQLNKPHPFIFNWKSVVIPSAMTGFLLMLFRPFNLTELPVVHAFLISIVFGLVVGFCIWMVVGLIRSYNSNRYLEDHWTVGKEIALFLSVLLVLTLVLCFVLWFLGWVNWDLEFFLTMLLVKVPGMALVPLLVLILFEGYSNQKAKQLEAKRLYEKLLQRQKSFNSAIDLQHQQTRRIALREENGKVSLNVPPAHLAFLKAERNYVEVFYLQKDIIHKKLIRNRLKVLGDHLPKSVFFQCHKSYIVNKDWIVEIQGNARNLSLKIDQFDWWIPVSRSKSADLQALFNAHSYQQ